LIAQVPWQKFFLNIKTANWYTQKVYSEFGYRLLLDEARKGQEGQNGPNGQEGQEGHKG